MDSGRTGDSAGGISFALGSGTGTKTWSIKVSYIECSNVNRPTDSCLQYFTVRTTFLQNSRKKVNYD